MSRECQRHARACFGGHSSAETGDHTRACKLGGEGPKRRRRRASAKQGHGCFAAVLLAVRLLDRHPPAEGVAAVECLGVAHLLLAAGGGQYKGQ